MSLYIMSLTENKIKSFYIFGDSLYFSVNEESKEEIKSYLLNYNMVVRGKLRTEGKIQLKNYNIKFKNSQWEVIEVVIEKLLQFGYLFNTDIENSKYQDEIKTIIENLQSYVLK